jgi:hypothetical protein
VVPQHFSQHRNRVVTVCAPVARFRLSLRMCYWHVRRRRALRHSTSRGDSFRTLTGLSVSLVSPSFVPSPSPCVASDARAVSGAVDDFLELRSRPWWVPHGHRMDLDMPVPYTSAVCAPLLPFFRSAISIGGFFSVHSK